MAKVWMRAGWIAAATLFVAAMLTGNWAAGALPLLAMAYASERLARLRAERLMRLAYEDGERARTAARDLADIIRQ